MVITDIGKPGIVIAPPDRSGMVQVQAGIIKTSVPLSSLELAPEKNPAPSRASSVTREVSSKGAAKIEDEISVMGMTVEEALLEVDRFLDNAVLSGITTLRIVHGKGTGALRSAIQRYLRGHKHVRNFRSGVYGEGEMGVTIVTLK